MLYGFKNRRPQQKATIKRDSHRVEHRSSIVERGEIKRRRNDDYGALFIARWLDLMNHAAGRHRMGWSNTRSAEQRQNVVGKSL